MNIDLDSLFWMIFYVLVVFIDLKIFFKILFIDFLELIVDGWNVFLYVVRVMWRRVDLLL